MIQFQSQYLNLLRDSKLSQLGNFLFQQQKLKSKCLFHLEANPLLIVEKQKRKRFCPCPQAKLLLRIEKFFMKVELHVPPNYFQTRIRLDFTPLTRKSQSWRILDT
jgi:hypothetical protein